LSSHISNYYTIISHSFNLSICSNFLSNSLSSQFSLLQSKFNTLKVLFPTYNHFQRYLLSKPNFLFVLARLMSNSLPTKDNLFSWNQSKSPLCNHCRIKDTILHTLFHCTKFRNLRITLQLSINLSSNNFNTVLTLASNSITLVNALVKFFHVAFYCFSPDDDRYDPIDSVSKRSFLIKHRSRWIVCVNVLLFFSSLVKLCNVMLPYSQITLLFYLLLLYTQLILFFRKCYLAYWKI
jgi:hypothetical protein